MATRHTIQAYQGSALDVVMLAPVDFPSLVGKNMMFSVRYNENEETVKLAGSTVDGRIEVLGERAFRISIPATVMQELIVVRLDEVWLHDIWVYTTDPDDSVALYYGDFEIRRSITRTGEVDPAEGLENFLNINTPQVLTPAQILVISNTLSFLQGLSDHGELTGLADDDHPQYLNEARGDARYSGIGHTHTKADVGLGNVDNTSDVNKPVSTAQQSALDLKENLSNKGAANGYAPLVGGLLPTQYLPALAVMEYKGVVANQAAMLAVAGEKGDFVVRSDLGTVWVITGEDPTLIGSWFQLSYPGTPVVSVNGQTGVIVLDYTAVGAAPSSHGHDASHIVSGVFSSDRIPVAGLTAVGGVKRNVGLDGQAVVGVSETGDLVFGNVGTGERRADSSGNYTYCGQAPTNSLESSSVWLIRRLEYASGAYVGTTEASGVNWTDRYTHTYS